MTKKMSLYFFMMILFLLTGCATINKKVKNKFDPMINTAAYRDVLEAMSSTNWPKPKLFIGGCDSMAVEFGNMKVQEKERVNTVYTKGNFLTQASSVSETETYTVLDGVRYLFVFDKNRILKYYNYIVFSNDKFSEEAEGGDSSLNLPINETGSQHTDCEGYADKQTKAASESKEDNLKKKLKGLKRLKDRKVITDEEYIKLREKTLLDYEQ